jgi:rhamnosyltransferase
MLKKKFIDCSSDRTCKIASQFDGVSIHVIDQKDFNHGATRELARSILGTDIVVFLTQDVLPSPGFLQPLIEPILNGRAVATYARQVPHEGAGFFEAFPRYFNYPVESHCRTIEDAKEFGVYTFFCSDSASAYCSQAVSSIGGIQPVLTNEDYFTVARLLVDGGAVCYVAESVVQHSHRYTIIQEFQRYFDTGYVRGQEAWVQQLVGNAESRGSDFVTAMFKELVSSRPHLLPYAIFQTFAKWIGYRIGFHGSKLPLPLKIRFSSQKYFWRSDYNHLDRIKAS